jgi:hypothetical protein
MSVLNLFDEEIRFTPLYPKDDFERDWRDYPKGQALEVSLENASHAFEASKQDLQVATENHLPRVKEIRSRLKSIGARLEVFYQLLEELEDLTKELNRRENALLDATKRVSQAEHSSQESYARHKNTLLQEKHRFYRQGLLRRAQEQAKALKPARELLKHELS